MDQIIQLFDNYGYIVLFLSLMLEILALPIPGEALMTYCGYLVYTETLNWPVSIAIAAAGTITGMTTSYLLGYALGRTFFVKYGAFVHLGPERLEKFSLWFEKYGNKLIPVAYYIPGIRHLTGYFSGISKIPYRNFALYSYLGAIIWTSVFITMGKILGENWVQFEKPIKKYMIFAMLLLGTGLTAVYFYRFHKQQIIDLSYKLIYGLTNILHSQIKTRMVIIGAAAIFIGMTVLTAGMIQDLLSNEFQQFDEISAYVITAAFPSAWVPVMHAFRFFTYYPVLILVTVMTFIICYCKGKNIRLEINFLIITLLGGEALEETLRMLFHRLGPLGTALAPHLQYTFPSENTLMATVTYGFSAYIILHHAGNRKLSSLSVIIAFAIALGSGISQLYLKNQFASDICAGYAFGLMWLSLNIILLEVFRLMQPEKR